MILVALCGGGLEKIVANEIRKLGECSPSHLAIIDSGFGSVRFESDLTGAYHALLSLRTADRLLLEAASFTAADFDELFEGTQAAAWEDYIPKGMGLAVDKVRSNHSRLAAETSIQSVVHKAAADRLCQHYRQLSLPEGGPGNKALLRVHLEKNRVQILLDLCGKPLFRRGYRLEGGAAPLRESTAAALLLQTLWRRKHPLYDPFCGAGTVVIEAALYAWDVAPGLGRGFAVSALSFADAAVENDVRRALLERIDLSRTVRIFGSDSNGEAVEAAKANLERALKAAGGGKNTFGSPRPACLPKLWRRPMEEAAAPYDEGFIITNPPYGVRLLDKENSEELYRRMNVLKDNFPSWRINVLSAHAGFESFFGQKADRCKKITSGALETYFYEYDGGVKRKEKPCPPENTRNKNVPDAKKSGGGKIYTW
ncbi:MAG: class I SAM-dependent RNA methyltransferase [Spirochaetaceae bacterium]|jgi:putative N6-adenine-specific DNA methylase|nr:class I SAM-dependent RNA methyltransferase [Spirochaetaceae bacterium]